MGGCCPDNRDLLEEALGVPLSHISSSPISGGNSGVAVSRVTGRTAGGQEFGVVIKQRSDDRPHAALWYAEDHGALDREYHVYALLERLSLPHARVLSRRYKSPGSWALVLKDLAEHYVLPGTDYTFTKDDMLGIIDTYAMIHSRTKGIAPTQANLQMEEGSEVSGCATEAMLCTLARFEIDGATLRSDDFDYALSTLLQCRTQWAEEPRCLVYSDFHQTNVALPKSRSGNVILFDWELARVGLPQFDALNAGFADDKGLACYAERVSAHGQTIDLPKFKDGLAYAELAAVFYTLWLLYRKLREDPNGSLPKWMRNLTVELFSGALIKRAREAERLL